MLSMHSRRPNTPGLSCLPLILLLSLLLSACGGSGTNTMTYTIGGTVTGLSAAGLTLTDNGGATLAVASGATIFTFVAPLATGAQYDVAVASQPTGQSCSVSSAAGTVSGNVTTVSVICVNLYAIGGTVTGLSASGLTLTDNGGAQLPVVSGATTFTFAAPLAAGAQYDVQVSSQPTGQSCSVSSAAGTVSGNVTTVSVTCVNLYSIGGAIRGLKPGAQLTLLDNGADPLTLTANGAFTFSNLVAAGKGYGVTVGTQPNGQFCEITDGSGTASADVTNAQVACLGLLYSFSDASDGASPVGGLIMDGSGNLYGTALSGGPSKHGTVFVLEPTGSGSYTESILYTFTGGSDGGAPVGGMIRDSSGNLYGTTSSGGGSNVGTVFELVPNGSGGYTESILHDFTGSSDGANPVGRLLMDSGGNLYGTTEFGGSNNTGTVFKLSPSAGGYTESILYSFAGGSDAANPVAGLAIDGTGNLYGTTAYGGSGGGISSPSYGTVFELASNGTGGYTESVLYRFTGGSDGANPFGALIMDSAGNLYGTTQYGGGSQNEGAVFKLAPNGSGEYTESVVYSFSGGSDGANPLATLILDTAGNMYGTTQAGGGSNNSGTVFMLSPNGSGGYAESVLYSFTGGSDGSLPTAGLIMDSTGNIYGTAAYSGSDGLGYGTVFEIYPH
jgi:uncharacterized repeat protein (TIGR03803 family)